jgi:hypothetical protein
MYHGMASPFLLCSAVDLVTLPADACMWSAGPAASRLGCPDALSRTTIAALLGRTRARSAGAGGVTVCLGWDQISER